MFSFESSRVRYLEKLFYGFIAFSLLGPTFGVPLMPGFKLTFFRIALFLLVMGVLRYWIHNRDQLHTIVTDLSPIRWYVCFFVFWFVYAVISLSWSVDHWLGIKYLTNLGAMLLLCLSLPYFVRSVSVYVKVIYVLWGTFFLIVLYGLFESITLIHLPASRVFGKVSGSVTSFFTNQNDLATCVTLALPFIITALFMLPVQKKYKRMIYFTGVLALYTLIITGSRSNTFLAFPLLSMTLIILIPRVIKTEKLTGKNIAKGIAAAVVAVIIANCMSFVFLSPKARYLAQSKLGTTLDMFSDIQDTTWELGEEEGESIIEGKTGQSATVRKYLILNGLRFLHQSHYLGVGPGNIEPLMKAHATKVNKVNIHNWWAELLVNFGVLIALLYMYLYFGMLWRLYKIACLKHTPVMHPYIRWGAFSSLASLIGYFLGGIAPSTAIHLTPMWISYGLGLIILVLAPKYKVIST